MGMKSKKRNRFSENAHTGGGNTAVPTDTAEPRQLEQAIKITKNENKNKVTAAA